jgi:N-acetylmuramoyl-L-alanine amidase
LSYAQVRVSAARVWPAADYTRITLESPVAVQHNVFSLDNPDRLVLDLEGADITPALTGLAAAIGDKDPYVKSVRVGRFKPGTIRLVFDLKSTVKPQVFALAPVGQYSHRLVLDLYPLVPPDPLIAFLDRREKDAAQPKPAVPAEAERPAARSDVVAGRMDTELPEPPVTPAGAPVPGVTPPPA